MNEFDDINEKEEFLLLKHSVGWKLLLNILSEKKREIVNRIVKDANSFEEINKLRAELNAYNYVENIVNQKAKGE